MDAATLLIAVSALVGAVIGFQLSREDAFREISTRIVLGAIVGAVIGSAIFGPPISDLNLCLSANRC